QGTILSNPNGRLGVGFNAGDPYNIFTRRQWGAGYEFGHVFNDTFTFKQNLKYSVADAYSRSVYGAGLEADLQTLDRFNFVFPEYVRSEERRVGKECRSRWSTEQYKKKIEYNVIINCTDATWI